MGNEFEVYERHRSKVVHCGALCKLVTFFCAMGAFGAGLFATSISSEMAEINQWAKATTEIAKELRAEHLSAVSWQDKMEALNKTLSYPKLLKFLNFDQLIQKIKYPRDIAAVRDVSFSKRQGVSQSFDFEHKVFAYRRGAITPPHGHNNMVSAHLVLKGTFHVRTFQRVRDEERATWLRPAIDKDISAGDIITMSDDRDNVHSFVAISDYAYLLEIPISQVNLKKKYSVSVGDPTAIYVDPSYKPASDGLIRAPILDFEEALRKFPRT